MRILVTGAGGLLGTEVVALARRRGHAVDALARADLDVTDVEGVEAALRQARPEVVVHCAAYTAVDRAEEEPERARAVNRDGSRAVASAAQAVDATLVYVSTDYVFDGSATRPYRPDDPPAPLSAYGRSKLEGELAVRDAAGRWLVARTSWLYGSHGRNFVTAILERAVRGEGLRVVADQHGRPTWARNLAGTLLDLVEREATGVWHVADGGEATWLEFAREALRLRGLEVEVDPVSTQAWGAPAPRPLRSLLDVGATERFLGRPMMDWHEALRRFLEIGG